MRKITKEASRAFANNTPFKKANTSVMFFDTENNGSTAFYLHGKLIAVKGNGKLLITHAGWPTATTRERLNGILEAEGIMASTYIRRGTLYYKERGSLEQIAFDNNFIEINL